MKLTATTMSYGIKFSAALESALKTRTTNIGVALRRALFGKKHLPRLKLLENDRPGNMENGVITLVQDSVKDLTERNDSTVIPKQE